MSKNVDKWHQFSSLPVIFLNSIEQQGGECKKIIPETDVRNIVSVSGNGYSENILNY